MIAMIVRAEVAFIKAAHCRAAAIEKTFVDRQIERCTLVAEHVDDSHSRAKRQHRLAVPALPRRPIRILGQSNPGSLRFLSKTNIITYPAGGADELDVAPETFGCDVDGITKDEPARRH